MTHAPTRLVQTQGGTAWHSHQKYYPTRYRRLNPDSFNCRGTIEFRYFDGTLNPRRYGLATLCPRLVLKSLNEARLLRGNRAMETRRGPLYRLAQGLGLTGEERRMFQHHKLEGTLCTFSPCQCLPCPNEFACRPLNGERVWVYLSDDLQVALAMPPDSVAVVKQERLLSDSSGGIGYCSLR